MNQEEAQFILGAYRPNSADAQDPQFQEALALARQDPVLARWFAEEQALDRAFAAKIRARPTPTDLKAQLLLARSTRRRMAWWRRPVWLAAAASFALLLAIAGTMVQRRSPNVDFARFRSAMAEASLDMSDHADTWGLDLAGYRSWLAKNRGAPDFILPTGLADKGIMACKIVEWQHHRVTMLCFKFSDQHLDLFVINAADLAGIALGAAPAFFAEGEITTAAWRRDGKIYLVAGALPKAKLQALL
ncbi:MAG: hypothetical protein EXS37_16030 [Opitutus sp.]|nr:hypothetical protein [Opitutus sp.]